MPFGFGNRPGPEHEQTPEQLSAEAFYDEMLGDNYWEREIVEEHLRLYNSEKDLDKLVKFYNQEYKKRSIHNKEIRDPKIVRGEQVISRFLSEHEKYLKQHEVSLYIVGSHVTGHPRNYDLDDIWVTERYDRDVDAIRSEWRSELTHQWKSIGGDETEDAYADLETITQHAQQVSLGNTRFVRNNAHFIFASANSVSKIVGGLCRYSPSPQIQRTIESKAADIIKKNRFFATEVAMTLRDAILLAQERSRRR